MSEFLGRSVVRVLWDEAVRRWSGFSMRHLSTAVSARARFSGTAETTRTPCQCLALASESRHTTDDCQRNLGPWPPVSQIHIPCEHILRSREHLTNETVSEGKGSTRTHMLLTSSPRTHVDGFPKLVATPMLNDHMTRTLSVVKESR